MDFLSLVRKEKQKVFSPPPRCRRVNSGAKPQRRALSTASLIFCLLAMLPGITAATDYLATVDPDYPGTYANSGYTTASLLGSLDIWKTFAADSGSASASGIHDAFTFTGTAPIRTAIAAKTMTISADTAAPSDGDTTHFSSADQIWDFCETTQNYALLSELLGHTNLTKWTAHGNTTDEETSTSADMHFDANGDDSPAARFVCEDGAGTASLKLSHAGPGAYDFGVLLNGYARFFSIYGQGAPWTPISKILQSDRITGDLWVKGTITAKAAGTDKLILNSSNLLTEQAGAFGKDTSTWNGFAKATGGAWAPVAALSGSDIGKNSLTYDDLATTGVIYVGQIGDYATIAEAIAVATSGQEIHILPGTYAEKNLVIPAGVSLIGDDRSTCKIIASQAAATPPSDGYIVKMQGGELRNLYIENAYVGYASVAVWLNSANDLITNCDIISNGHDTVCAYAAGRIEDCLIWNKDSSSQDVLSVTGDIEIRRTTIKNASANTCIWIGNVTCSPKFWDCDFINGSGAAGSVTVEDGAAYPLILHFTNCTFEESTGALERIVVDAAYGSYTTVYLDGCRYDDYGEPSATFIQQRPDYYGNIGSFSGTMDIGGNATFAADVFINKGTSDEDSPKVQFAEGKHGDSVDLYLESGEHSGYGNFKINLCDTGGNSYFSIGDSDGSPVATTDSDGNVTANGIIQGASYKVGSNSVIDSSRNYSGGTGTFSGAVQGAGFKTGASTTVIGSDGKFYPQAMDTASGGSEFPVVYDTTQKRLELSPCPAVYMLLTDSGMWESRGYIHGLRNTISETYVPLGTLSSIPRKIRIAEEFGDLNLIKSVRLVAIIRNGDTAHLETIEPKRASRSWDPQRGEFCVVEKGSPVELDFDPVSFGTRRSMLLRVEGLTTSSEAGP